MPNPRRLFRNVRLVVDAAVQHLHDDPALLAIQISRRLPMAVRRRVGLALHGLGTRLPGAAGTAALGAFMAGDVARAEALIEKSAPSRSRLRNEVAVLLDRTDLIPPRAPAATRARAAWAMGDLDGAIALLEESGRGDSVQTARYRSELELLGQDFHLATRDSSAPIPSRTVPDGRYRALHFLTNSLPHTQSGYALRTHSILTSLAEHGIESVALTRTGYPVMVGKAQAAQEDLVDGIRYRRTLPTRLGTTPADRLEQEVAEALELVREFRPDVLHATTDYRNALVAQAVSSTTGIPWVYEVRGLMEQTWIASHRRLEARVKAAHSQRVTATACTEAALARDAAGVVTLGEAMAGVLVGRGVPAERIVLVPNGVDETLLGEELDVAAARSAVGVDLPEGAFVVGGVSAVVPYEGHHVLLRAAASLLEDPETPAQLREGLHVVVVGDGTAAPDLLVLARELGISDRVHLPGRVPRPEARRWVQAMDVVSVPRLDLEVTRSVTPQKPIEAMALGRPVIASDLPALRETVTGGDGQRHAVLVTPGDAESLAGAIRSLHGDEGARRDLAAEGRVLARERTWSALMRRYGALYASVAQERGTGMTRG
ncbi:glycosyltransferase family 4 protein [Brachybacterium aquaticum]|uniref:Glycosyltransferase involved in cell wall biosynthesis n=1 Tax=Brachybacterium aquaticum TaxID=1432564 RepID=A0A841A8J3_9MICO|nr:glycosyltransferase family 4 protein [Brachybacterium aquaticum]MBB5830247.1 glycosyltransferase involved in cell wall biosynthesis [Brachybacterium aquaticum]